MRPGPARDRQHFCPDCQGAACQGFAVDVLSLELSIELEPSQGTSALELARYYLQEPYAGIRQAEIVRASSEQVAVVWQEKHGSRGIDSADVHLALVENHSVVKRHRLFERVILDRARLFAQPQRPWLATLHPGVNSLSRVGLHARLLDVASGAPGPPLKVGSSLAEEPAVTTDADGFVLASTTAPSTPTSHRAAVRVPLSKSASARPAPTCSTEVRVAPRMASPDRGAGSSGHTSARATRPRPRRSGPAGATSPARCVSSTTR